MNKLFLTIIISIVTFNLSFSQKLQDGQIRWSANEKLTIDDFKIKINNDNNTVISSQFLISYSAQGFDFIKRNLNQRVENLFIGKASWINTSKIKELDKQVDFQQVQFDLAEIQARKFRQRLFLDKWNITKGFSVLDKISNEIMAEFSEIRLKLIEDTQNGTNEKEVLKWKEKITTQLKELHEFRYENKKKIKRKK
ncbi:hypothetical protein [Polaribacter sargassicola]|uniref:hypothetical protein n=1 Tax=Polaribacter sargassicola TaxID=2836891 RepID=UPI001F3CAFA3|nr:hypothetical protein [Polaribacter sp. DS7-9]MCG1037740.1 hypothetical protein [Polaribacter sp. DS7-9]